MKEKLCVMKKKIVPEDIGKNALFPVFNSDVDMVNRLKNGKEILVNTRRPRNPRHHKLIFAIAKCTIANSSEDSIISKMQPYDLIKGVMYTAGIVDMKFRLDGEVYYDAKSLKFENMSEDEFLPVSDVVFKICAENLKIEEYELRRNYIEYL